MTREEKKKNKIERSIKRRAKRKEIYVKKIRAVRDISRILSLPLSIIDKQGNYTGGSWYDPNSPTGYSQKCSYDVYGICQSPCNGDC